MTKIVLTDESTETPAESPASQPEPSPADAGPSRKWPRKRWIVAAVLVLLSPALWSYGQVLTAASTDGLGVRSVEWARTHGGAGVVNAVERWWYAHHQPAKGGAPASILTHAPGGGVAQPAPAPPPPSPVRPKGHIRHLPPPTPIAALAAPALPAEGVWHAAGRPVDGVPAVYVTALRPDAVHTGLATGVAWVDPTLVRGVMFAGRQLPGGTWANEAPVPASERPALVAAFNSGFQLGGSRGGYYAEGRTVRPL
ncbi:MAG: hypothetical protein JWP02_1028, partial [Acidimicrobiales bacterium]|nr:hypothetical protein [Acidimicrobiales bacterium]